MPSVPPVPPVPDPPDSPENKDLANTFSSTCCFSAFLPLWTFRGYNQNEASLRGAVAQRPAAVEAAKVLPLLCRASDLTASSPMGHAAVTWIRGIDTVWQL